MISPEPGAQTPAYAPLAGLPRDWRVLFASFCVSSLGDRVSFVALFALVQGRFDDIEGLLLIALSQALPALLLGGLAGKLAARGGQRDLIMRLDFARAAILIALLLAPSLAAVLALITVHAAFGVLYRPPEAVLETQLVAEPQLPRVNALRMTIRQINAVVGPGLAGLLLAVFSPAVLIALDAASYVISGLIAWLIRHRGTRVEGQSEDTARPPRWGPSIALLSQDGLIVVFGAVFILNLVLGMQGPLFFVHLDTILDNGASIYAYMMSALSLGAILAASGLIWIERLAVSAWGLLCVTVLLDGAALLGWTLTTSIPILLLLAFAMGMISSVYGTIIRTLLQTWPDVVKRPALLGLFEQVGGLAQILSLVIAGAVVQLLSERSLLQIGAVAEIVLAFVALMFIPPKLRARKRGKAGDDWMD